MPEKTIISEEIIENIDDQSKPFRSFVTWREGDPISSIERRIADFEIRVSPDNPDVYDMSFSSEYPVDRWWGNEILDHQASSVKLDRLKKSGSILINHDPDQLVGVVTDAYLQDGRARAKFRFSPSDFAQEKRKEVDGGFWRNASVSYQIDKMRLESEANGVSTYRVTSWEPLEVSLVSIPADPSVGVGRSIKTETKIIKEEERKMDENEIKVKIEDARKKGGEDEASRVKGILALANTDENKRFIDVAHRYVENGQPVEVFQMALSELKRLNPQPVINTDGGAVGMTEKEIRQYSIVKAMRDCMVGGGKLEGLEREASDATAKICRKEPKGFFIPQDVMGAIDQRGQIRQQMQRVLQTMIGGSGGMLVDVEVMTQNMIELLRNLPAVTKLGAITLSGLVGQIALPRVTGGATAYWLSETGTVTASDQAFGQLGLTPHRLVGDTAYTKELLTQTSLDVESFVRNDLMTVLAIEKDRAAIFGQIVSGNAGEPLGILGTPSVGSVSFGAAATWAKIIDFETQVAAANALMGSMGYLTSPGVRAKWKAITKIASSQYSDFLWEKGVPGSAEGIVNGYRAIATNQVPNSGSYAHRVIFGNWADLIIAEWAGIDVVVDPYSLKKQGQIEITVTLWTDIGVRHAGSFTISSDSGAQ